MGKLEAAHFGSFLWAERVQVDRQILDGYVACPEGIAIRLAALKLQALSGDHSEAVHKPGYLKYGIAHFSLAGREVGEDGRRRICCMCSSLLFWCVIPGNSKVGLQNYLPPSVSQHGYTYWQERIFRQHKRLKGLTENQAKEQYIRTCKENLEQFGLTFFDVRDDRAQWVSVGVGEDGLYIFGKKTEARSFCPPVDSVRHRQFLTPSCCWHSSLRQTWSVSIPYHDLKSWEKKESGIVLEYGASEVCCMSKTAGVLSTSCSRVGMIYTS